MAGTGDQPVMYELRIVVESAIILGKLSKSATGREFLPFSASLRQFTKIS